MQFTIYGSSDDLVEIEQDGRAVEEYDLRDGGTRVRITAPGGDSLDVLADFDARGGALDASTSPGGWVLAAVVDRPLRAPWVVTPGLRPDGRGEDDPALFITVPEGTRYEEVR